MIQLYICGDSFCVSDAEYDSSWADLVAEKISTVNLAQVSASNLLIARQVDVAIQAKPDFILVNFTSCTRGEKLHKGKIVPFSYHTASIVTTPFDHRELTVLREYFANFFDLDLAIYQNKITIEHTLQKLIDSGIPFLFDQGGFEHPKFGGKPGYFEQYHSYRSHINLWDYTVTQQYRPYYHITDPQVHQQVAKYYLDVIGKHT